MRPDDDEVPPRLTPPLIPAVPAFDPAAAVDPIKQPPSSTRQRLVRAGVLLFALWLFLCAIALLKDGAKVLAPALHGSVFTDSHTSELGMGWLGAMLVMSGSPIAVSALALLDGGVVDTVGAFMMLTGSRLGASLVVLVVAFVYAIRTDPGTGTRRAALSIGIFALALTALVYVPAMLISVPLLHGGALNHVVPRNASTKPPDIIKTLTGVLTERVEPHVPGNALFVVGLVLLLLSVRIIDRSLPEATDAARLEEHSDWRNRQWLMFGLGSVVALVTMSVSVALTVLVPAVAKGLLKREQTIPYIMGANITTLGDTLLTAIIIGKPAGIHIVIAELVGTTSITLLLLALAYRPMTRFVSWLADVLTADLRRIALFAAVLFAIPITLILAF